MAGLFDNSTPTLEKASLLKLVVSNQSPIQKENSPKITISDTGFAAEVRMRSPYHYALVARDDFHGLSYELNMKIQEHNDGEELEARSAICHFPNILAEELDEFVEGDQMLYGMIIIQFQIKILKKILLFCATHNILNLIIYADETFEGYALVIYQSLAIYEDKFPSGAGEKTKISIQVNQKTSDKLAHLMDEVNHGFRQELWRNQRTNYAIKAYLKSDPSLKFFR